MKKLLPIFSLILLASCGEKGSSEKTESGNILKNLTYSVDTVVVDPGEELINLGSGLVNFSLSPDGASLFIFDSKRFLIQKIDLDRLKLTNSYQFEKDGPNGIGGNPPQFQLLEEGNFLIVSNGVKAGVFSKNGEKLKNLTFNAKEIEGLDLPNENLITNQLSLSKNGKFIFALTKGYFDQQVDLIVILPESKSGKTVDMPAMDQAPASTIYFINGNSGTVHGEGVNLQLIKDNLFVSNSANSDVYRYDYEMDSLALLRFPHKIVSPRKTGTVKNNVSDQKEFEEERGKLLYQTGFEKLMWDDYRKQFFRFARKPIPDEKNEGYDQANIYLFTYDSNLVLLGETQLEKLKKVPPAAFFKDGKLWSYINVDDELGFAVFTFDF
jgi:hypothetical protein